MQKNEGRETDRQVGKQAGRQASRKGEGERRKYNIYNQSELFSQTDKEARKGGREGGKERKEGRKAENHQPLQDSKLIYTKGKEDIEGSRG